MGRLISILLPEMELDAPPTDDDVLLVLVLFSKLLFVLLRRKLLMRRFLRFLGSGGVEIEAVD